MLIFRKAKMTDVENLHTLINSYAEKGLMLPRSRSMIYECLREFTVVEEDGKFLGTGGLHIIWEDLAEIRALALVEEVKGRGSAGSSWKCWWRRPGVWVFPGICPHLPEGIL